MGLIHEGFKSTDLKCKVEGSLFVLEFLSRVEEKESVSVVLSIFGISSLKVLCIDGAKGGARTAPSSQEGDTLVLIRIRAHCISVKICLCPATNTANLHLHLPAVKHPEANPPF